MEQERNDKILTLYKWFTRNSETNMDEPIPLALLHDRKFVAAAEAMITKKLVAAKSFADNLQPIYETASTKQSQNIVVSMQPDLSSLLLQIKPAKRKQEVIASKEDQVKYAKKKDEWFDVKTSNPGQVGAPLKIEQTKTQLIAAINPDNSKRPWRDIAKPPKKSAVPLASVSYLHKLNKNQVTIELSAAAYSGTSKSTQPSERKEDTPKLPADVKLIKRTTIPLNRDLANISPSRISIKMP